MKILLLVLLLTGCATGKPEIAQPADVQLCALQVVKVMSDSLMVVRMHCEPEGTKS